jgi:hydroxymethylbilane synthase
VNTRLDKIARGIADATILARAGLNRLGIDAAAIGVTLDAIDVLPAPAQGAIGIACRENDPAMRAMLAAFDDEATARAITCERALLAALDGSCRTPIAAFARDDKGRLVLDALIAEPDGTRIWRTRRDGSLADAEAIGREAGAEIRAAAGPAFFARLEARYEDAQR